MIRPLSKTSHGRAPPRLTTRRPLRHRALRPAENVTSPHRLVTSSLGTIGTRDTMANGRRYASMPGPRPMPLLGNSWRFALGMRPWRTSALDGALWTLRAMAGSGGVAKVAELFGHPDLVFPFCAEETERVYRREDAMPHRAVAPCLKHYKQELRKDFFGEEPGLIGV